MAHSAGMRMSKRFQVTVAVTAVVLAAGGVVVARGKPASSHPAVRSTLGTLSRSVSLDAIVDTPGPIEIETVYGADWHVPLSGLLNLDHPEAKRAGLVDREEPIQITFHALKHPTRGTFIVDTGIERAVFDDPEHSLMSGIVGRFMKAADMVRRTDTRTWIESHPPIAGVFLTHLHLDHISGMRDVPPGTMIYAGPGETTVRSWQHFFGAPVTDRALVGKPALAEWPMAPDPDRGFAGVLDVFGDQSVFALHVPGHTPGSTAYVARTPGGAVLMTGDACHTTWGWEHGVEPGTFSHDRPQSADSLARMKRFAARHPKMVVRVGHQGGERSAK